MDEIQKELVDIEKSIVKLFNEKKVNDILKYFRPNFIGFSSTKYERLTNLTQLKKTFLHYLDEGDEVTYNIQKIKVNIYGESALTSFYWTVEIKKKKKTKTISGRGSHIFLILDGVWRIVHEHFSKAH